MKPRLDIGALHRRAPAGARAQMPTSTARGNRGLGQDWLGEPESKNEVVNDVKTLKSEDYSLTATR